MEPFSAAASAVALLGTSITCARKLSFMIHAFIDAPMELTAPSNEVNDLKNAVLSEIEFATLSKGAINCESQSLQGRKFFLVAMKSF